MAISMVARRQKNLPTAPRTRAACLPIRNIASGGMTASACVVESSNSARPENDKRVRRYQRCLPLNTRQWRRFAASCVYGHGHGMCGDARPETKRRRAAWSLVPFSIRILFYPVLGLCGHMSGDYPEVPQFVPLGCDIIASFTASHETFTSANFIMAVFIYLARSRPGLPVVEAAGSFVPCRQVVRT